MLLRKSLAAQMHRSWFLSSGGCAEVLDNLKLGSCRALLCLITLLSVGTVRTEARGFIAAPTYPAGIGPVSVAVDDFNGDGILDLAVVNRDAEPPIPGIRSGVSILLGKGDGTFEAPLSYVIGHAVWAVATGDFNGDGHPDLAVIGENSGGNGTIYILLGNGDGTFNAAPRASYPAPAGTPWSPAVGDFNGDGIPDLVLVMRNYDGTGAVKVLLGKGDGTFEASQHYATGPYPTFVALGDFNGDAIPDLAVSNSLGVSILLGNGDGTFQAAQGYPAGSHPRSVAVGDFNGDGILDLAMANEGNYPSYEGTVSILLGNGDGTFRPNGINYGLVSPDSVAVGDFNGDGHLDIVLGGMGVVSVLLGKGDGTFQAPVLYAAGDSVAVGDFNGDGILDIVAVYPGADTVSIFLGKGDGTFPAARCYLQGGSSVALGDFNGDGIPDLAAANHATNKVNISLGKGDGTLEPGQSYDAGLESCVAVGDFNGDAILDLVVVNGNWSGPGTVSVLLGNGDGTFQTALTTQAGNGPYAVAVGDFNGDGKLDIVTSNYASVPVGRRDSRTIENDVRVFFGNGDGTFQAGPIIYDVGSGSLAVADFNGDGTPDLAVIKWGELSILLGKGDGTFQRAQTLGPGPYGSSVAVGDFNNDGIPDLAVASAYPDDLHTPGAVHILLGNGDGTFQRHTYAVASYPWSMATGDFNKDGILDLAVVDGFGVNILLGNGDGTFQPAQTYAAGPGGQIAVADFNNDGFPDVVLGSSYPGVLTVLLNTP